MKLPEVEYRCVDESHWRTFDWTVQPMGNLMSDAAVRVFVALFNGGTVRLADEPGYVPQVARLRR